MHLLTTPLLTDSSGEKFGKSAGNAIWLSADMTSPYAFYQYWLNVEDASVLTLLKVFTDRGPQEVAELERQVEEEPWKRAAQRTLAADVTTLVHGAAATAAVQAASEALFGRGDLRGLDGPTLRDATAELPGAPVTVGMPVVDALVAVGLADSTERGAAHDRGGRGLGQRREGARRRGGDPGGGRARRRGRRPAPWPQEPRRRAAPAGSGRLTVRSSRGNPLSCRGFPRSATRRSRGGPEPICVLRGECPNVLDVSPRGRNGHQAAGPNSPAPSGRSHELAPTPEGSPRTRKRPGHRLEEAPGRVLELGRTAEIQA